MIEVACTRAPATTQPKGSVWKELLPGSTVAGLQCVHLQVQRYISTRVLMDQIFENPSLLLLFAPRYSTPTCVD